MKVSELESILSRLDPNGEIGIERSRQTDIPGVIEVELYEFGIKKQAIADTNGAPPRDTYLLYATSKASSPSTAEGTSASSPQGPSGDETESGSSLLSLPGVRRRPVMDSRPLVPATGDDQS